MQKFVLALHMSVSRLSMHPNYIHVATYTKKNILHLYKRIRLDRAEYGNISTESH